MKLKKVAEICKRHGFFRLCDEVRESGEIRQWLGDGAALYLLTGLPALDAENLCTMFDITEKQREKLSIRDAKPPKNLCLDDWEQGEKVLHSDWPALEYEGMILQPFSTREGISFIQEDYLEPLEDMADYLQLYERENELGQTYIVAKNGMEITAIILPVQMATQSFVEKLEELARLCRAAMEKAEERARREQEKLRAEMDSQQENLFQMKKEEM